MPSINPQIQSSHLMDATAQRLVGGTETEHLYVVGFTNINLCSQNWNVKKNRRGKGGVDAVFLQQWVRG